MKTSQIRILAILACIALVLGIALFALRYEKAPEVLPPLVEIPMEEIDQLCFNYLDRPVTLQLHDCTWQVLLSNTALALPAKQDVVKAMIQELCAIRPQQMLEEHELEQIPMVIRQASVEILSGTGTEEINASQQIIIGSMNAVTDQLYVQVANQVYLTDTRLMEILSTPELDLLEQHPIPKPENHSSVTVENANGQILLSCAATQTGGEDGVWFAQTPDGWVEADQNAAYNFYFLTWDMHWKTTASVITQGTNLADFGLDNPQAVYTLHYGDEVFRLYLGENLPDGTTYAMCDGSTLIYTMDTLLASWLAEATIQSVLPQSS